MKGNKVCRLVLLNFFCRNISAVFFLIKLSRFHFFLTKLNFIEFASSLYSFFSNFILPSKTTTPSADNFFSLLFYLSLFSSFSTIFISFSPFPFLQFRYYHLILVFYSFLISDPRRGCFMGLSMFIFLFFSFSFSFFFFPPRFCLGHISGTVTRRDSKLSVLLGPAV